MIFLTLLALIYFLPTLVAANRGHSVAGIFVLNLFLGWTCVVWCVLLLWAVLSVPARRVVYLPAAGYYGPGAYRG